MHLDLLSDLQELARSRMAALGFASDAIGTGDELLLQWLHAEDRIPPAVPMNVAESAELISKLPSLDADVRSAYDGLKRSAMRGEPLRPYLSRRAKNAAYVDPMLADWGILHFHLGAAVEEDGFIERTDELVAGIFEPSTKTLYLLDIHPHKGFWSRQQLIEILDKNWPELAARSELKGIDVTGAYTDAEVEAFRKMGVNVVVPTSAGRAIVSPGGGLTTARTSLRNQRELDEVRRTLGEVEKAILLRKADIEQLAAERGFSWDELDFRLTTFGPTIQVVEQRTQWTLNYRVAVG